MEKMHWAKKWALMAIAVAFGLFVTVGVLSMAVMTVTGRRGRAKAPEGEPVNPPATWMMAGLSERATRIATADRIGNERAEEGVRVLREHVGDRDPEVRIACVRALGRIGHRSGVHAVRMAMVDRELKVRLAAIEAMSGMQDPIALTALLKSAGDADAAMRRAAAGALARREEAEALDALDSIMVDRDVTVRRAAAKALAGRKRGPVPAALVRAAIDPDPEVRGAGLDAVCGARGEAFSLLESHGPRAETRAARLDAVRALAGTRDPAAAAAIALCLDVDLGPDRTEELRAKLIDGDLCREVVEALAALGPAALDVLGPRTIRGRCGLTVKQAVADACIRYGVAAQAAICAHVLNWTVFPYPDELRLWVRTLGEIGDAGAVPALARARDQGVPGMGERVEEALRKIEARTGAPVKVVGTAAAPPTNGVSSGAAPDGEWPGSAVPLRLDNDDAGVFFRDVTVLLRDALFREGRARDLELYLGRTDAAWRRPVLGWSFFRASREPKAGPAVTSYNAMDHEGEVVEAWEAGNRLRLTVNLRINDDAIVPGGPARYTLTLTRSGETVSGTFAGEFAGKAVQSGVSGSEDSRPWPSPATNHPVLAGAEHPRLLFRKRDLPALRRREGTPEGKAILARLRTMLESAGGRGKGSGWTLWHGAGCGLLFQLSGDPRFADQAREHVERALSGAANEPDPDYSWTSPASKSHAGSSYAAVAMAYDLCYEAWDPAYREGLARRLQDRVLEGSGRAAGGLVFRTRAPEDDPALETYGAWNGGAGLVVLAILGDPGTDGDVLRRCHRILERRAKRALLSGFSDTGYFYIGQRQGRAATNGGLAAYLQALRVAEGKDMVENCPNAQWLLTKWLYELVRGPGGLRYVSRHTEWDLNAFTRGGVSGGDFAQGFGICPPSHRPSVLWFYNHVVEPGGAGSYDAIGYPHHAVYSFVNWPIGIPEQTPGDRFPNGLISKRAGYYAFRSGWTATNDLVMTLAPPTAMYVGPETNGFWVGGWPMDTRATYGESGRDGASVIAMCREIRTPDQEVTERRSVAVDFSGLSGALALFVEVRGMKTRALGGPAAGPSDDTAGFLARFKKAQGEPTRPEGGRAAPVGGSAGPLRLRQGDRKVTVGGLPVAMAFLHTGPCPEPEVVRDGNVERVAVGRRTIAFDGERIVLGAR